MHVLSRFILVNLPPSSTKKKPPASINNMHKNVNKRKRGEKNFPTMEQHQFQFIFVRAIEWKLKKDKTYSFIHLSAIIIKHKKKSFVCI